jgi:hypothetical protein
LQAIGLIEKRAKGIVGQKIKEAITIERSSAQHLIYSLGEKPLV